MRDEAAIYVTGHPLLRRRCTSVSASEMSCVVSGVALNSATARHSPTHHAVRRLHVTWRRCSQTETWN